jgi:predicted GNAT family acetyltransferase
VKFIVTRDVEEFAARASDFLAARVECNILATVLMSLFDGAHAGAAPLFVYGVDDTGDVQYAALRTPPWVMLTSTLGPRAAHTLLAQWLCADPQLPGVSGPPGTARAIGRAWSAQTGGHTECRMSEALHELEQVHDPPRPAEGELRLPGEEDRQRLIQWMRAFALEAGLAGADQAEAMVDMRLARDALLVWHHGGVVSLVGSAPEVAGVVRIGPVYTPPEFRRRGYAGTAVATASRRALAGGARKCILFTDLANPTSNKIYAEVGYRRIAGWEEHAFNPA